MSFKRRLLSLESRLTWKPPVQRYPLREESRRELLLPLPDAISQEEFYHALELLKSAQAALKQNINHTEPLKRFVAYAQSMHDKYNGEFARKENET